MLPGCIQHPTWKMRLKILNCKSARHSCQHTFLPILIFIWKNKMDPTKVQLIGFILLILSSIHLTAQHNISSHCQTDNDAGQKRLPSPRLRINGLTESLSNSEYLANSGSHFWSFSWTDITRLPALSDPGIPQFFEREMPKRIGIKLDPSDNQSYPLVDT